MRYTVERHGMRGWEYWTDAADEFTARRIARAIARAGYPARVIDNHTGKIIHSR